MIAERIKEIINYKGISTRKFEQLIGCSNGVIAKILSKNTDISSIWVSKIIDNFGEISPDWLITGQGEMLRTAASDPADHIPEATKMIPASAGVGIPLIPTSAMAGIFQGETVVFEYECERYIVPAFKDAEFLIAVKGSSMIPKYNSGDIVACKRMPIDTFFQWNKVYVLDTEQGALIKRVKKGSKDETLTIYSDNPNYEPFELNRKQIYHIALVIGVIRLE